MFLVNSSPAFFALCLLHAAFIFAPQGPNRAEGYTRTCRGSKEKASVVRAIGNEPSDNHGVEGISFVVLAGEVQHGMKDMEVLLVSHAPGISTPIHTHGQEEILVVLKGKGTLHALKDGQVKAHVLKKNSTATIPANLIHQIVNDGDKDLQVIAVMPQPPVVQRIFKSWTDSEKSALTIPIPPWATCGESNNEDAKDEL